MSDMTHGISHRHSMNEWAHCHRNCSSTVTEVYRLSCRVHLVTCGPFWSCDSDGGHTIQSAVSENPMLHANIMALCLVECELLQIEVLPCGNKNFGCFWLS